MLAEIVTERSPPARAIGSRSSSIRRAATVAGEASWALDSSSTTNSSPPSRPTVSCSRMTSLKPLPDDGEDAVAGCVPVGVVDRLEAVDVDVERRGDAIRMAPVAGQQLLGAVEHECAVRQPGQPVVQRLVAELAGLLLDQLQRPRAPRREDEQQQAEQQAERADADREQRHAPGCRTHRPPGAGR